MRSGVGGKGGRCGRCGDWREGGTTSTSVRGEGACQTRRIAALRHTKRNGCDLRCVRYERVVRGKRSNRSMRSHTRALKRQSALRAPHGACDKMCYFSGTTVTRRDPRKPNTFEFKTRFYLIAPQTPDLTNVTLSNLQTVHSIIPLSIRSYAHVAPTNCPVVTFPLASSHALRPASLSASHSHLPTSVPLISKSPPLSAHPLSSVYPP